jgi:hypothetical protein
VDEGREPSGKESTPKGVVVRSLLPLCTALLGTALAASTAAAQVPFIPPPPAPDMCRGGGYYCSNCCGMRYGPCYNLQPACPPFQGMVLGPQGAQKAYGAGMPMGGSLGFPSHVYARSPRDYYMVDVDPLAYSPYNYGPVSPLYAPGRYAPPPYYGAGSATQGTRAPRD